MNEGALSRADFVTASDAARFGISEFTDGLSPYQTLFRTNPLSHNAKPQRSVQVFGFASTLRWGFALRLNY